MDTRFPDTTLFRSRAGVRSQSLPHRRPMPPRARRRGRLGRVFGRRRPGHQTMAARPRAPYPRSARMTEMLTITPLAREGDFAAYCARPAGPPRPAIIVHQEIFGVNADSNGVG